MDGSISREERKGMQLEEGNTRGEEILGVDGYEGSEERSGI